MESMIGKRFIKLFKSGHVYYFTWEEGNEKNLYLAIIECAKDPNTHVALIEALKLIRKLSQAIKANEEYFDFFLGEDDV